MYKCCSSIIVFFCSLLAISTRSYADPAFVEISSGKSRIVIYRERKLGSLFHPTISINGKPLWDSESGVAVSVDIDPGRYSLKSSDYEDYSISFVIYPGETKYVNLGLQPGTWRLGFIPEFQFTKYALSHLQGLELRKLEWHP